MKILHLIEAWCFAYLRATGLLLQCSDSPDMTAVNTAAAANADIARESLAWYKQQYEDQRPMRERAAQRADEISLAQARAMDTATDEARRAGDYRRSVYEPLEREIVRDARNFDTEGERERLAGLALGDVRQSFANARDIGIRDLARRGVNPSDGGFGSVAKQLALGEAAASAGAATKSRSDSLTLSRALRSDAAALGRNLPANQATQAGLALNAGNNSVGNAQVPISLAQSATNQVGQGFQQAANANNSAGNLYLGAAQVQSRENDGLIGGLASLGMAAGGMGWKPFGR